MSAKWIQLRNCLKFTSGSRIKTRHERTKFEFYTEEEFGWGVGVASPPETGAAPSLRAEEFQVRKILSWLTLLCRVDANSSTSAAERFRRSGSRMGMRLLPTASRRT